MSLVKYVVPALLAVTLLSSPAAALPGSASSKTLASSVEPAVIEVTHRRDHRVVVRKKVVVKKKVVYRPGGVYRVAPVGWRRVGARPVYWQTAGCILVGGVWFCP
ncbi:MAG TPA: hypothetical protein VFK79_06665 [Xanthobacteraceae bacterium]|nr:hypothetical protein [Xanthobacteraceae bacterium]